MPSRVGGTSDRTKEEIASRMRDEQFVSNVAMRSNMMGTDLAVGISHMEVIRGRDKSHFRGEE